MSESAVVRTRGSLLGTAAGRKGMGRLEWVDRRLSHNSMWMYYPLPQRRRLIKWLRLMACLQRERNDNHIMVECGAFYSNFLVMCESYAWPSSVRTMGLLGST